MEQNTPSSERPRKKRLAAMILFLSEVRQELKLICWPDWRQIRSTTVIVVIFVVAVASYVYGIDVICDYLLEHLLYKRPN